MNRNLKISWNCAIIFTCFISILLIFSNCSFANGIIIPMPPRPDVTERIPPLRMKFHIVQVDIQDQVAKTKIEETFVNDFHRDIEGMYLFPLPEEASISDFSMFIDGKKVKGEILEKDKALKIYEDIVRRMKDPALLEYAGRDLFKLRIYPIPARGEKKIEINYTQLLKKDAGMINYMYPLNVSRFISSPVENLTLAVNIRSQGAIKSVYSPTHKVEIKRKDDNNVKLSFEEKNLLPDKDFLLYYTVSDKEFSINLLTHREDEAENGFFLMLISPKFKVEETEIIPKDVIFLFDKSGSMSGKKIKQAKNALNFCVNNLKGKDKFNIITFSTDVDSFKDKMLEVNDKNIERGLGFIEKIEAEGGTNINDALENGIEILGKSPRSSGERQKMIVFLTDGLPTVGETNIDEILKNISKSNKSKIRIFAFGVGYDVNFHFLDKLTQGNNGVSDYVKEDEDIEVKISNFYAKVSEPLLADPKIEVEGIDLVDVYPKLRELPDIFKGSQLNILGRYKNSGRGWVKLKGKLGKGEREYKFSSNFPEENKKNDYIPNLWASRKIGYLLDYIRLSGENDELINEIIKLSKKFGIVTPYTSSLVLEDTAHYSQAPSSMAVREAKKTAEKLEKEEKGISAFAAGKGLKALKDETQVVKSVDKVKTIGNRTFVLRENKWIDTEYKDEKVKNVKYLSEEYFELIKKNPDEAKYLSIGEKITTKIGGIWYNIE